MIFNEKISEAIIFATKAHDGVKRKYTGEPYICHPIVVAGIVSKFTTDPDTVIAAILHDVVEDTDITVDQIQEEFGIKVAMLVLELTDEYTKEKYPHFNRIHRKELELKRLKEISEEAKKIKLSDVMDNTLSVVIHDKSFARTYLPEKEKFLLEVISETAPELQEEAWAVLNKAKDLLEQFDRIINQ